MRRARVTVNPPASTAAVFSTLSCFVIPAKAGIQESREQRPSLPLDARASGNDGGEMVRQ